MNSASASVVGYDVPSGFVPERRAGRASIANARGPRYVAQLRRAGLQG